MTALQLLERETDGGKWCTVFHTSAFSVLSPNIMLTLTLVLLSQAACMLVDLGADPYTIDKVIAGFGMPMGPFRCHFDLPLCKPQHTLRQHIVQTLHQVPSLCTANLPSESLSISEEVA